MVCVLKIFKILGHQSGLFFSTSKLSVHEHGLCVCVFPACSCYQVVNMNCFSRFGMSTNTPNMFKWTHLYNIYASTIQNLEKTHEFDNFYRSPGPARLLRASFACPRKLRSGPAVRAFDIGMMCPCKIIADGWWEPPSGKLRRVLLPKVAQHLQRSKVQDQKTHELFATRHGRNIRCR